MIAPSRPLGTRSGIRVPKVQRRGDERGIVDQHLPHLDNVWRSTVERLIEVILGELPNAQHERSGLGSPSPVRELTSLDLRRVPHEEGGEARHTQGALLADPQGAMEGDGQYTRTIAFPTPDEIDADVVAPILRQAANRKTKMMPSKPSRPAGTGSEARALRSCGKRPQRTANESIVR